jgi:hypothetical protein
MEKQDAFLQGGIVHFFYFFFKSYFMNNRPNYFEQDGVSPVIAVA